MTSLFRRAPLVSVVLAAALTACGTSKISEGPIDYGSPQAETNRLDVPPDLSKLPNNQNRYAIPGEVVSAKRVTQSQGAVVSELAPNQMGDVRFHREGAQAWLSIQQPIERVWPVVHAFWQENGFTFRHPGNRMGRKPRQVAPRLCAPSLGQGVRHAGLHG
jgi:outer membrane protein assembly factor BamC